MDGIEFWHWLSLAGVLGVMEMLVPGSYLLWLGIAAAIVGGICWLWPGLDWHYQGLLFAVLSVAVVLVYRRWLGGRPAETDQPHLNRRGEQYVGRLLTLDRPIVDGVGRAHVEDTMWRIVGPDLPSGTRVRVTGVDGASLKVEPVPGSADDP